MKSYKLTHEQFQTLMTCQLMLKNRTIQDRETAIEEGKKELVQYYDKEINELNMFADEINIKFNTNF